MSVFSGLFSVKVKSGVHNDPDDEKPGRRGHEPLLGEFPGPSVLLLVDLLEGGPVRVEEGGVDGGEAYQLDRRFTQLELDF